MKQQFRCILHGSFRKHFGDIEQVYRLFTNAGIEVLAPKMKSFINHGEDFLLFEDERGKDPRLIELLYLQHLKRLGENGFSYFVNPGGYIGKSAAYELGIAHVTNTQCFYMNALADHPAYTHKNAIWHPQDLVNHIRLNGSLPKAITARNEHQIHQLWEDLMVPGSVVAAGAVITNRPRNSRRTPEILLVKTHKWGDRYSIIGGKVRRNERLTDALVREIHEETQLRGVVGTHICTFDQIKDSGYYQKGIQHLFVDNVVSVPSKRVVLNDEAQDYIWALPEEALAHLDIEPNARHTIELYAQLATASG